MKIIHKIPVILLTLLTGCTNTQERFLKAKTVTIESEHGEEIEYFKCLSKHQDINQLLCYAEVWQHFHEEKIPEHPNGKPLDHLDSRIPVSYHHFFRASKQQAYRGGKYIIQLAGYHCEDNIRISELLITDGYKVKCNKKDYFLLEQGESWLIRPK